jgi:hypothetical protein
MRPNPVPYPWFVSDSFFAKIQSFKALKPDALLPSSVGGLWSVSLLLTSALNPKKIPPSPGWRKW